MKQALIELVDVILKKIQDEPDAPLSETGLRKWLMGEGYQKPDIEAAMQLVRPRFDAWQEGDAQPSSAPWRWSSGTSRRPTLSSLSRMRASASSGGWAMAR